MAKRFLMVLSLVVALVSTAWAETSEIRVDLKLDGDDYVVGERIRGVIDIANSSPDSISVGYSGSKDRCFVEVFRASDVQALERTGKKPMVANFRLNSGEGQKLEVFVGDHYGLRDPSRYLVRPVLVHRGVRYEGMYRAFDIVEGVKIGAAMQMFANKRGLQREFELVYWSRNHAEHLFLKAWDSGSAKRRWETRDLGAILRIDKPSISVLKGGEVIVLHRINQDQFVRSEFWSLPDALEFRVREAVQDPESAGTARVREMYKEGGVKPVDNPWWKFW